MKPKNEKFQQTHSAGRKQNQKKTPILLTFQSGVLQLHPAGLLAEACMSSQLQIQQLHVVNLKLSMIGVSCICSMEIGKRYTGGLWHCMNSLFVSSQAVSYSA